MSFRKNIGQNRLQALMILLLDGSITVAFVLGMQEILSEELNVSAQIAICVLTGNVLAALVFWTIWNGDKDPKLARWDRQLLIVLVCFLLVSLYDRVVPGYSDDPSKAHVAAVGMWCILALLLSVVGQHVCSRPRNKS